MRRISKGFVYQIPSAIVVAVLVFACARQQPVTALEAYSVAKSVASNWQPDAELVTIKAPRSGTNPNGAALVWHFYFVSESQREILFVGSIGSNIQSIQSGKIQDFDTDLTMLQTTKSWADWYIKDKQLRVDSDVAWRVAQAHGGTKYAEQGARVVFLLSQDPQQIVPRPVWMIFYILSDDPLSNPIIVIDAQTGEFVEEL